MYVPFPVVVGFNVTVVALSCEEVVVEEAAARRSTSTKLPAAESSSAALVTTASTELEETVAFDPAEAAPWPSIVELTIDSVIVPEVSDGISTGQRLHCARPESQYASMIIRLNPTASKLEKQSSAAVSSYRCSEKQAAWSVTPGAMEWSIGIWVVTSRCD